MKIGIFHWSYDNIVNIGGGEILASNIGKALNAPVHCIVRSKKNVLGFVDITDKISFTAKLFRGVRMMDYLAWSSIDPTDFGDFDIILTSGMTSRAMIVPEDIPHVNLCFSPPRWLYDLWHQRRKSIKIGQNLIVPVAEMMRIWDCAVDKRVDYYISISPIVKRRLWHYLKRESDIIYPPIDVSKYSNKESEGYYLFISRLISEKRPEEAIRACIKAKKKLIIVGTGELENKLKAKYKSNRNIIFTGYISEKYKSTLLSQCEALIFTPISEDFGIVPIEALASGKPVICSNDGYPPILIKDKYGVITDGSAECIEQGIIKIESKKFNPGELIARARMFDFSIFKEKLSERLKYYKNDFDIRNMEHDDYESNEYEKKIYEYENKYMS
jgi:glycosyltransferase involved in cell wall biosynthesis